ncbi:PH domain-containing protein [Acinetobacter sp. TGL-Y2]|uniref:PH domain-containing protein n=1 Tax=Acinetobacter sp. TGL-Y2 TaxID=1407071 RepID=UPI001903A29A|nr:PH domain-containing protein [Acinetobacter sp. TGL-Y2]MBJ9370920.1 PH domain-containing protein [Acinetobacter sp. TGL-Y2]
MPTLEQIKQQLSHINGVESLFGRKEIKELPSILWDDEIVEGMITGTYNNGIAALFATNKRLIFVDKGLIFGLKVEDFPYDKITSVQYETGMLLGKITIFTSGNKAILKDTDKVLTKTFSESVRAKINNVNGNLSTNYHHSSSSQPTLSMEEKLNQLERLQKLRDSGILTDKELVVQKAKILG